MCLIYSHWLDSHDWLLTLWLNPIDDDASPEWDYSNLLCLCGTWNTLSSELANRNRTKNKIILVGVYLLPITAIPQLNIPHLSLLLLATDLHTKCSTYRRLWQFSTSPTWTPETAKPTNDLFIIDDNIIAFIFIRCPHLLLPHPSPLSRYNNSPPTTQSVSSHHWVRVIFRVSGQEYKIQIIIWQ